MSKEKPNILIMAARRMGNDARLKQAMEEVFNENPTARVFVAKANGQHEIIEGTTYEDVTAPRLAHPVQTTTHDLSD